MMDRTVREGRAMAHEGWWLRLQIGLTGVGGITWVAGLLLSDPFWQGVALGLFLGALSLRLGRRAAADDAPALLLALLLVPTSLGAQEGEPPTPPRADSVAGRTPAAAAAEGGVPLRAVGGRSLEPVYGLLAVDPATRQIGAVVASGGFSAASSRLRLEAGAGAVLLTAGPEPRAGARLLGALRAGRHPRVALEEVAAEAGSDGRRLQLAALSPSCDAAAHTGEDLFPWSGSVGGRSGGLCYLAAGTLLADSTPVRAAVAALAAGEGDLTGRLLAALEAGERAAEPASGSRSAALWVSALPGGRAPLGRPDLRLQVERVQRPAAALGLLLRVGRADALAREANGHVDGGAFERAISVADSALATEPALGAAWLARGRALLALGRDGEAEEAFRRMLEANPYMLHLLGDPGRVARDTLHGEDGRIVVRPDPGDPPTVRSALIPYRPRLLLRLDLYRRSFFSDVDFPRDSVRREAPGGVRAP